MASNSDSTVLLPDGSFDWLGGVDSSKTTTIESELNPNGLKRNQLAWMINCTARGGGITQRTGWQPLVKLLDEGHWQGGYIYEPDSANPYLVCQISGILYSVLLEVPYTITDLSGGNVLLRNPAYTEMAFFVQGENYLIVQAGDYFTPQGFVAGVTDAVGRTLPLFWDGTTLRRSIGITTATPAAAPNQNEIPAAMTMDYYGNRIWYAEARQISGGDIVGGPSGNAVNHYRDSILSVTENPLCFGGDGFTVPTNAGNIRAIKHSANLNASLGQGQLYIFTRKQVYSLTVPVTRTQWIAADNDNRPQMDVVQITNGAVSDRSVVPVNGDLFYQSLDPAIRSLITAVRYFEQWGNTPISQNELRALQFSDRALMRFSSAIEFDNRLLNLVLPVNAADNQNIVNSAILPLDFDLVTNLEEKKPAVWEGAYEGLQFLHLFSGDFGGLERAFAVCISDVDGSLNVWELTLASRTQNGDNRVVWAFETPAFTWAQHGLEFKLKQLRSGELWIDKISGTVEIDVYYRVDADPCWRLWMHFDACAARNCAEQDPPTVCYPEEAWCEGYSFTKVLQEPKAICDSQHVRPTTIGYQFQMKVVLKGWCRIRGIMMYATPHSQPQFTGIACPTSSIPKGMNQLPNPFK